MGKKPDLEPQFASVKAAMSFIFVTFLMLVGIWVDLLKFRDIFEEFFFILGGMCLITGGIIVIYSFYYSFI